MLRTRNRRASRVDVGMGSNHTCSNFIQASAFAADIKSYAFLQLALTIELYQKLQSSGRLTRIFENLKPSPTRLKATLGGIPIGSFSFADFHFLLARIKIACKY